MSKQVILPEIYAVTEYSDRVAAGIGLLMPALSSCLSAAPMDQGRLETFIESPHHDQLLAELDGRVVGAAAMSLMLGTTPNSDVSWLGDFVVSEDESVRGHGVGYALFWHGIIEWSRAKRATHLLFTSRFEREQAHRFYFRQGCTNPTTALFAHDLVGLVLA